MASIHENKRIWNERYDWPERGDEWSEAWGGPAAQWYATIYPRIRGYLRGGTIVEIAPGHGRWTQFLAAHAQSLVGVDVSENCVAVCRDRFRDAPHASFFVNDGRSLDCVADGAADFIFSFDSLVHAEAEVIADYLAAMAKKLAPDGIAFIHHSNLGAYPWQVRLSAIPKVRGVLRLARVLEPCLYWRAASMDAGKFVEFCHQYGLLCTSQELLAWGGSRTLIDCFSVITRGNSIWAREYRSLRNSTFMLEAATARSLAALYGADPLSAAIPEQRLR